MNNSGNETVSGYIIEVTVSPNIEEELNKLAEAAKLQSRDVVSSMVHAHYEYYDHQIADDMTEEEGCHVLTSTFEEYPYHVITMVCDDEISSFLVAEKEAQIMYDKLNRHMSGTSSYVNLGWMTLAVTGVVNQMSARHDDIEIEIDKEG